MIYSALLKTLPFISAFEPVAFVMALPQELHATDVVA